MASSNLASEHDGSDQNEENLSESVQDIFPQVKYRNNKFIAKKFKVNGDNGPTKEEFEIAKYIRFNTPCKATQINKQDVSYFIGSKAVDTLMKSKWATGKGKTEIKFTTRNSAIDFMSFLSENNFFYRAMKNKPEKSKTNQAENDKVSSLKQSSDGSGSPKALRQRKKNKDKSEDKEEKKEDKSKDKGKVKKRYKLTVHDEQIFTDSKDIFIWVYSPTSTKNVILGVLLLCGVIGATLFPLWPPQLRTGVYYLSLTGAGGIGSIFVIALLRSILFAILWLVTMGNIHLWILPNILADVGFFESFQPWYTYENKKQKPKDKNSDDEGENDDNEDDTKEVETVTKSDENEECNAQNTAEDTSKEKDEDTDAS